VVKEGRVVLDLEENEDVLVHVDWNLEHFNKLFGNRAVELNVV